MNIEISSSCKVNDFLKITMERKIEDVARFLLGLESVAIHCSGKKGEGFKVTLKASILFVEKEKEVILHAEGKSKKKAFKNSLVKLTAKYGKLCRRYTQIGASSDLQIAV